MRASHPTNYAPGIYAIGAREPKDVAGRDKPGHDHCGLSMPTQTNRAHPERISLPVRGQPSSNVR